MLSTVVFRASPRLMVIGEHVEARGVGRGPTQDATALRTAARKIRVGFMSKFFTVNHAHGQLLQVRLECKAATSGTNFASQELLVPGFP